MTLPLLGHQALPERALDVRHRHGAAIEAHVQALVLLALEAILAAIAGPARRDRYPVSDGETGDALAQRTDGARHLVPEDHRLAHADRPEAAVVVVVQIGATDAASLDGDLDLSGPRSLRLALLDAQVLGGMNDNSFHGAILR